MSFRNNKGSISLLALIVVSMIALGVGSLMVSNFSVYQLSKSYHILRERLLIKKMLFQMTEEVVLSKYELSNSGLEAEVDLHTVLEKEVNSIVSKTGLIVDAFEVVENQLSPSHSMGLSGNTVFENGYNSLNPRISSYLNQGPYTNCGYATFLYDIHGRPYSIQVLGYGIPLSNFDLTFYDLPSSLGSRVGLKDCTLYYVGEDGSKVMLSSVKGDINYKNRKHVSIFCNAYEWLWNSDHLEKLAKDSKKHFVLEIPYNGELEDNGIILINQNEVSLDLEKIDFDVVVISDPLTEGVIKIKSNVSNENPLVIISYGNLKSNKKTILEIDKSSRRPIIFFGLNTEIIFNNNPEVYGAFFLDSNSKARGTVFIDGHFSCYSGADFLDLLNLKFIRTDRIKTILAGLVPHVFLTDIVLKESP